MATIVFTNTGRQELIKRLRGLASGAFATVGVGTGTGVPARTDTALFADAGLWTAGTVTAQGSMAPNDTLNVAATITATSTVTIKEVGVAVDTLHTLLAFHGSLDTFPTLQAGDHVFVALALVFP